MIAYYLDWWRRTSASEESVAPNLKGRAASILYVP